MKKRGVLSVYLAISLMVMLSLILVLLESARVHAVKAMTQTYADLSAEMLFSAYTKPLADRYGIFVLDTGENNENLVWYEKFLKKNLEADENPRNFGLNADVSWTSYDSLERLEDDDWGNFKAQLVKSEKYTLGDKGISAVTKWLKKEDSADGEAAGSRMAQDLTDAQETSGEADEETESKEETPEDTGTVKDPRKGLAAVIKKGILKTVMEDKPVSDAVISSESCTYRTQEEKLTDAISGFADGVKAAAQLSEGNALEGLTESLDAAEDELLIDSYIQDHFSSLSDESSSGSVLKYEQEYILYGRSSDEENLEDALTSVFNMRLLLNLAYLYQCPSKKAQTDLLAAKISTASALPALEPVISLLLMVCWAGGEALADTASLADGGKVPFMKTDATWSLTLSQLSALASGSQKLSSLEKKNSSGLDYERYLYLLTLMTPQEKKLIRMSQLMECNVRLEEGYEDFSFADCITGISVSGEVEIAPLYFQHPGTVKGSFETSYSY